MDQAKVYIGLSSSGEDARVAALITAVSMVVLRYIDIIVRPQTFVETRRGDPRGIMLRNWPVIAIDGVAIDGVALPAGVDGGEGWTLLMLGNPQRDCTPPMLTTPLGEFDSGGQVTITYKAGCQVDELVVIPGTGLGPLPDDEGQAHEPVTRAVDLGRASDEETSTLDLGLASDPLAETVTISASGARGAWISDEGVIYADGTPLRVVEPGAEALGAYSVSEAGAYSFAIDDVGAAVVLRYGYVPADLANACLEWIHDRLAYRGRVGQASKAMAGGETTSFRITDTPDFVKLVLRPFVGVVPLD